MITSPSVLHPFPHTRSVYPAAPGQEPIPQPPSHEEHDMIDTEAVTPHRGVLRPQPREYRGLTPTEYHDRNKRLREYAEIAEALG